MKKIIFIFTISLLAVGALFAQVRGGNRGSPESVKIEGTLQLYNGQFAVASGDKIYYVPRIGRYVGFIDNLKEGSNASFEGYVFGNFLYPVKMTISGKTYDLTPDRAAGGPGSRRNNDFNNRGPNRFGPGFGGNGWNRPRDNFWGRR